MIHDIKLTDSERAALERGIERLYDGLGIATTGLEVMSVVRYGENTLYRVFYTYEIRRKDKWRDIHTSDFFRFNLSDAGLDSVEFDRV